jgi:hypothetical protein
MNLLELQVLAMVSRIPDGNDAPAPEFDVEFASQQPHEPRLPEAGDPDHQSTVDPLKPRT